MDEVLENKSVPLTLLFPHERNYRAHPDLQVKQIAASLTRFGQVRSIVAQACENGSYTIVAGHGVVLAAERLGYRELRADILPSSWSPAQITGYLVADNHLSQEAIDDEALLTTLLAEQVDAGYDLASLGSDEETLRQMLAVLGDVQEEGSGEEEQGEDTKGRLLALLSVTIEEPRTVVTPGDIWTLSGKHTLVVAHVFKDWSIWARYLRGEACIFLPFPGPLVALSDVADTYTMVLVQPDPYIAGHLLDRYTDIHGKSSVTRAEQVAVSPQEEEPEEREEARDDGE